MDKNEVERITPSPSRAVSRWLNVVLDLNGILCVCTKYRFLPRIVAWNPEFAPHSSSVPARIGPKAVYIHPLCSTFFSALSGFADITIWSSMCKLPVQKICEYLFRRLPMPLHIFGQDSGNQINVMIRYNRFTTMKVKGIYKDIFLKTLSKGLVHRFNGKFTKNNTIIIDDNPVKHILNDFKNVLLPVSWSHDGANSSDIFLMDTLLPCLQKLHRSQDLKVAAGVRLRIGQPMLCEDPSSIKEYLING